MQKLTDESTDLPLRMSHLMTHQSSTSTQALHHQSITSTSSRKSSLSECGPFSTSPNTITTNANAIFTGLNITSINSSEENTPTMGQHLPQQAHIGLSQSKSATRILETVPYPKLFGAKFCGLPRTRFFLLLFLFA
jgi:hypothetical protein